MTTEEKRKALDTFCMEHECYTDCPLSGDVCQCGRGATFTIKPNEDGYMTDDEINAAYNIVFPDSNRREFSTGAVRDVGGKGRMDLLPWAAIMEVAKHCENGAKKYGAHNVDKGIPTSSLCDSGARHLAKYIDGWTDEPHLVAAAWNLLWAIQMEIKHPELCDVPWRGDNNAED